MSSQTILKSFCTAFTHFMPFFCPLDDASNTTVFASLIIPVTFHQVSSVYCTMIYCVVKKYMSEWYDKTKNY